jgi:hypothetical protein
MLEVMDRLFKKRNFFSGNNMEKEDTGPRKHEEFYYEGQHVSNHDNVKEEQNPVVMKEKRTSQFFAHYNMFF